MSEEKEIMNAQEVATMLGYSRSMLQKLVDAGELKPITDKPPARERRPRLMFYRSDVEQFIARRQAQRKPTGRVE